VAINLVLTSGDVTLRIIRRRDASRIERIQMTNREWFRPWEATNPTGPLRIDFRGSIASLLQQLRARTALPFVVEYRGELVGQLNVSNILFGSVSSAFIGYWIDPNFAGKDITPKAVALAIDYVFQTVGLHRIEIDIRPENAPSLRVVQKLGLRYEGLKRGFIHISNAWRDHHVFAITKEEVPEGLLNRYLRGETPVTKYPFD